MRGYLTSLGGWQAPMRGVLALSHRRAPVEAGRLVQNRRGLVGALSVQWFWINAWLSRRAIPERNSDDQTWSPAVIGLLLRRDAPPDARILLHRLPLISGPARTQPTVKVVRGTCP